VAGDFIGFRDASSLWLFSAKTVNVEMGKPQQRLRIGGSGVGPTHRQRLIADRSAKGPRTPTGRARMTVGHDCCGDVGHRYEGVQTSRLAERYLWKQNSHDAFVSRVRTCHQWKWGSRASSASLLPLFDASTSANILNPFVALFLVAQRKYRSTNTTHIVYGPCVT
jgi:hypothetical protein